VANVDDEIADGGVRAGDQHVDVDHLARETGHGDRALGEYARAGPDRGVR